MKINELKIKKYFSPFKPLCETDKGNREFWQLKWAKLSKLIVSII